MSASYLKRAKQRNGSGAGSGDSNSSSGNGNTGDVTPDSRPGGHQADSGNNHSDGNSSHNDSGHSNPDSGSGRSWSQAAMSAGFKGGKFCVSKAAGFVGGVIKAHPIAGAGLAYVLTGDASKNDPRGIAKRFILEMFGKDFSKSKYDGEMVNGEYVLYPKDENGNRIKDENGNDVIEKTGCSSEDDFNKIREDYLKSHGLYTPSITEQTLAGAIDFVKDNPITAIVAGASILAFGKEGIQAVASFIPGIKNFAPLLGKITALADGPIGWTMIIAGTGCLLGLSGPLEKLKEKLVGKSEFTPTPENTTPDNSDTNVTTPTAAPEKPPVSPATPEFDPAKAGEKAAEDLLNGQPTTLNSKPTRIDGELKPQIALGKMPFPETKTYNIMNGATVIPSSSLPAGSHSQMREV